LARLARLAQASYPPAANSRSAAATLASAFARYAAADSLRSFLKSYRAVAPPAARDRLGMVLPRNAPLGRWHRRVLAHSSFLE